MNPDLTLMWLLNTKTLELKEVADPKDHKYAILSHVWEDSDRTQTFQDIRAIHARCVVSGEDPRSLVTEKVRRFCLHAESAGYEWVWLDTCCIDKSSSAELSEAINSMFVWYKEAVVCYAYLYDVDDDDDPRSVASAFRRSRWHTRGWTLQELIAPRRVIFLSRGWFTIGTKVALIGVLADVSGIDHALLACDGVVAHTSFSVARRMSWASKRQTTRVEDRAYCLMGLFGITMPIIYGEGERAFVRLQAEILRTTYDDSIFAWGPIHSDDGFSDRGRLFIDQKHMRGSANGSRSLFASGNNRWFDTDSLPLATSPSDFASSADYGPPSSYPISPLRRAAGTGGQYTFTSHGLSIDIPICNKPLPARIGVNNKLLESNVYIAALCCTKLQPKGTESARTANLTTFIILFLTEVKPGRNRLPAATVMGRRYYHVGAEVPIIGYTRPCRGAVVHAHHTGAHLESIFARQELMIVDYTYRRKLSAMSPWRAPAADRCHRAGMVPPKSADAARIYIERSWSSERRQRYCERE